MPAIQFRIKVHFGYSAVARNSLRRSKILNKLRGLRRQHPTLEFTVQRGVDFVVVSFVNSYEYTMFALIWPPDYPRWEDYENDIS